MQGVNKEFQQLDYQCFHQIVINLLDHVTYLVGFGLRPLPLSGTLFGSMVSFKQCSVYFLFFAALCCF